MQLVIEQNIIELLSMYASTSACMGSQVGVVVLSSPFTSGGPGSSPARSTSGLGFQSLPDSVGFSQNITSGVFLPPLKLYLLLIIFPYRFLQACELQCLQRF